MVQDSLKLICECAGALLLVPGVIAMFMGLRQHGEIDFTAPIFKGKIRTGSAGLLLVFFAVILLGLPVWKGKTIERIEGSRQTRDTTEVVTFVYTGCEG